MENCLNKYFADEFTSDEKTEFLIEVENSIYCGSAGYASGLADLYGDRA